MNISDTRFLCLSVVLWGIVGCSSKPAHLSIHPAVITVKASKQTPAGQQATVETTLRNDGGRPLKVLGVTPSCSCTVATSDTSDVLAPGQETQLKFKVSVPLFGRSESVVTIATDAEDTPSVRLVIQIEGDGEPVPRVLMQTQNLELHGTVVGQPIEGELEIQSVEPAGSVPWIQDLQPSLPAVQVARRNPVSEEPVADNLVYRRYVFDVNATSPAFGRLFVNLTPVFTSPGKQSVTVVSRVTLETVSHVSVVPSELVLSRDELKSGFTRSVIVLSKDGRPFQIRSVTWPVDSMAKRSLFDEPERPENIVQRIELRFIPQASESSMTDACIEIETSHPTAPHCRLPVRVKTDG